MNKANSKQTILVVDDDIDFLTQMQINLQGAGFEVITAEGQNQAEEVLAKNLPDLAIVDLMMENMDGGFALSYYIKKIPIFYFIII